MMDIWVKNVISMHVPPFSVSPLLSLLQPSALIGQVTASVTECTADFASRAVLRLWAVHIIQQRQSRPEPASPVQAEAAAAEAAQMDAAGRGMKDMSVSRGTQPASSGQPPCGVS